MDKKELAAKAVELLKKEYPDAICSLEYVKPHELLFATRLAAQCTDARVNMVTPVLYSKYQNEDLSNYETVKQLFNITTEEKIFQNTSEALR